MRQAVSPLKLKFPVKICVENQQIHQLLIQFINYVWWLLHISALHCHLQGGFLVSSERCSIEKQSIVYCGWTHPQYSIDCFSIELSQKALENLPEYGNVLPKHAEATIHN